MASISRADGLAPTSAPSSRSTIHSAMSRPDVTPPQVMRSPSSTTRASMSSRSAGPQVFMRDVVGRRRASGGEPGGGQHHRAGADRRRPGAAWGELAQPVGRWPSSTCCRAPAGEPVVPPAARNDDRRRDGRGRRPPAAACHARRPPHPAPSDADQRDVPVGRPAGIAEHLEGQHRVQLVEAVEDHDLDTHEAILRPAARAVEWQICLGPS